LIEKVKIVGKREMDHGQLNQFDSSMLQEGVQVIVRSIAFSGTSQKNGRHVIVAGILDWIQAK
jgi:hypothetical protein